MKIKEVCQQTGLTEKTVRYYVERELLHPQAMEKGDRIYTEFSSEDIRRLERVAALRKAGFSIEAILTMLRLALGLGGHINPTEESSADPIEAGLRRELAEEETNARQLLATFSRLHSEDCRSMDALADSLLRATRTLKLPAPDAEPDFSRFETISQEEKERALQEFLARDDDQQARGRTILRVFIAIQAIGLLISLVRSADFLSNLLSTGLSLLLLTLLYKGYTAVRYFYVGCNLIAIIEECYLLTCLDWAASPKGSLILFLSLTVFFILLQSATCVMLLFSKSVKKFLYSQRNG